MSSGTGAEQQPATRIVRARRGRLLGGVCAGLPNVWGLGTNGLRLLFVVAGLCGGIGVVVYLACWLVIPTADQDPDRDPVRSVVLLAWATGGLVAFVLVAAAAALATVFGLGWFVFALAAAVIAFTFGPVRPRIPQVAALLTVAALTLPAVAVALTPIRLTPQTGDSIQRPTSFGAIDRTTYRSGLGTLLIDLRRTPVPPSDGATLRIDAGLRRTIVALPSNSCVRVRVNYDIRLFPARLATLLTGRQETPFHDVVLFGRVYGAIQSGDPHGSVASPGTLPGPLLTIDFSSQGGGLYVRDYPDTVLPDLAPDWPGFLAPAEPRPLLRNEPRRLWKPLIHAWRQRLSAERAGQRRIQHLLPGPCAG